MTLRSVSCRVLDAPAVEALRNMLGRTAAVTTATASNGNSRLPAHAPSVRQRRHERLQEVPTLLVRLRFSAGSEGGAAISGVRRPHVAALTASGAWRGKKQRARLRRSAAFAWAAQGHDHVEARESDALEVESNPDVKAGHALFLRSEAVRPARLLRGKRKLPRASGSIGRYG